MHFKFVVIFFLDIIHQLRSDFINILWRSVVDRLDVWSRLKCGLCGGGGVWGRRSSRQRLGRASSSLYEQVTPQYRGAGIPAWSGVCVKNSDFVIIIVHSEITNINCSQGNCRRVWRHDFRLKFVKIVCFS